jgi:hypothetical protein
MPKGSERTDDLRHDMPKEFGTVGDEAAFGHISMIARSPERGFLPIDWW